MKRPPTPVAAASGVPSRSTRAPSSPAVVLSARTSPAIIPGCWAASRPASPSTRTPRATHRSPPGVPGGATRISRRGLRQLLPYRNDGHSPLDRGHGELGPAQGVGAGGLGPGRRRLLAPVVAVYRIGPRVRLGHRTRERQVVGGGVE